mgnify:FL=1
MTTEDRQEETAKAVPIDSEEQKCARRDFLLSIGKWSKVVVAGALFGGALFDPGQSATAGTAWANGGRAWANRGGAWANRGGSWANHAGAWANHGTAWANRGGVWVNGGRAWANRGGAWVNR